LQVGLILNYLHDLRRSQYDMRGILDDEIARVIAKREAYGVRG
jgi:hypothetical protein